jgi:hypothetical protein
MTSSGPAWLIASIGFNTVQPGTTSFNLQIGYRGMQYIDTSLSATDPEESVSVLFGTDSTPSYTFNANTDTNETQFTKTGDSADVVIQAVQAAPGDYNLDGIVDAADYTVWRDTLGSTTDLRANGNNSGASAGIIDQADYLIWKSHFGNRAGSGAGGDSNATVPEPTTGLMLIVGMVAICHCRRL